MCTPGVFFQNEQTLLFFETDRILSFSLILCHTYIRARALQTAVFHTVSVPLRNKGEADCLTNNIQRKQLPKRSVTMTGTEDSRKVDGKIQVERLSAPRD